MNASSLMLERRYRGTAPLRALWAMCTGDRTKLFFAGVFQIIKHSPVWIMPIIVANIVDLLATPRPDAMSGLLTNLGLLAFVVLQNSPNNIVFMRLLSLTARNLEMNLRAAICRRLQHLSIHYYTYQSAGTLQSKLLRDVESVQQLLMNVFEPVLSISVSILAAIVATALREPWFLAFYAVTVPLAVIAVYGLRRPIQQRNQVHRQKVETLSARLIEMTQLVPMTRAHGEEQFELEQVGARLSRVWAVGMELDFVNAVFSSTAFVIMQLLNGLVLGLSCWLYLTQAIPITLGNVVLLTGYFNALVGSLLVLIGLLPQISKGFEAIHSIGEILECPDLEQNEGIIPVNAIQGRVVFDDVSYRYPDAQEMAIEHISFEANPGETIAFVGTSGAGKSTRLNLVIGFLRPMGGRILIDGQEMADLDLRTYRRFLSVVPQDIILFDGTVRENVCYGQRQVPDLQVEWALRTANALDFVEQLPQSWDTVIGERGARLSGGQKQRLAIARALIRDPRILVLDEATSALDTVSETLIQEALARLMKDRTTFVVAHRLSTIRNATCIAVIDQGQLKEIGSHAALLEAERHLQPPARRTNVTTKTGLSD